MDTPKTIHLHYHAMLREKRGCAEETIQTSAATPLELYGELRNAYGFAIPADRLNIALNNEMSEWNVLLKDGDEVTFIPPVAGGLG